jgi:predicted RecB family nuclease
MLNTRETDRPTSVSLSEAHRSQELDLIGASATPGLAREIARFGENQPPITREILESFLACKTKSYLKLHGQRGTKSEFEALSTEIRAELRNRAFEDLISRLNPEDVMRGVTITEAILKIGAAIILDATIDVGDLSLCCDALKRVKGDSRLGGFHYAPILVYEGMRIRQEHKRALEIFSLASGEVQGRCPDLGFIVCGEDLKIHRVRIRTGLGDAKRVLEELMLLRGNGKAPRLTLNDHCQVCEFNEHCRSEATAADDISLLRGMSEKAIKQYRKKGIDTLVQLSRTFRPRRPSKRDVKNRRPHSFGLQAQAVRDRKTYIHGTPTVISGAKAIFLDIEGDQARDFVYLIGLVIVEGENEKQFSFWADTKDQESEIFEQFVLKAEEYQEHIIYHYGSYEAVFLKRMRREATAKRRIDRLLGRSVNVLALIYGTVYFPTFSNGLKDVASTLGFSWTETNASGLQSLVWRHRWERGDGDDFKNKLVVYNLEDCSALRIVTERIREIADSCNAIPGKSPSGAESSTPQWAKVTNAFVHHRTWSTIKFACEDFDFINKCSYFDYQRQRVHIRTGTASRRSVGGTKRTLAKPRISQKVRLAARACPECGSRSIFKSGPFIRKKLVYDLRFTVSGAKRRLVECQAQTYRCADCGKSFLPRKFKRLDRFSHNLKSWAMYMHVVHDISFPKIETMFRDLFGVKIDPPRVYQFKLMMASYYSETAKGILKRLASGNVIYADETEVKLKKTKGYVVVLSNTEEVMFLYRSSREVDSLSDLLTGFSGVLVTDFYPAYDSLGFLQQKCLVHLIRDLNGALLGNPFDDEFKHLAFDFGKLLKSIVLTIDKHGLKRKHLSRYRLDVDRFYSEVIEPDKRSETANRFKERFLKYREKLFAFLDHDGVAWNNNYAEHAIKTFAHYRVRSDGNVNETGLEAYLTLLSVHQTCKNKGVGLLGFLLSGQRDIDKYRKLGKKVRKPFSLDVLPSRFYISWPSDFYTIDSEHSKKSTHQPPS